MDDKGEFDFTKAEFLDERGESRAMGDDLSVRLAEVEALISDYRGRQAGASSTYEAEATGIRIRELEEDAAALRAQIQALRGEGPAAQEHGLPLSPFEQMVVVWEQQVLARFHGRGEIIGDERMEALGAKMGLNEEEIGEAYKTARDNIDRLRQGEGDVMDDLMGRITELPSSGEEDK